MTEKLRDSKAWFEEGRRSVETKLNGASSVNELLSTMLEIWSPDDNIRMAQNANKEVGHVIACMIETARKRGVCTGRISHDGTIEYADRTKSKVLIPELLGGNMRFRWHLECVVPFYKAPLSNYIPEAYGLRERFFQLLNTEGVPRR